MSFSTPFGTSDQPATPRPGQGARGRRGRVSPLGVTVAALVVIVVAIVILSEVATRYLWFDQLGFQEVLTTRWVVQAILFVIGALVFALPLHVSLRLAYSRRPVYPPVTREDEALEQFRSAVEPLRRGITILAPILVGAFAGLAASRSWENVLLFLNAQDFGATDPQFGLDVGFFVFTLPVIDLLLALGRFTFLIALVGGIVGHFVYGGVAWRQDKGLDVTRSARRHLGVLAVLYLLMLALSHWFERYGLLNTAHARFEGASYTDIHAILPAKTILAIAAVIVAAMFVLWIIRGDWRIPAIGTGLMVLATLAVGAAYPALIEQFRVEPNARALEKPYIQRNIESTRTAFGLDKVDVVDYAAKTDATPGTLRADADATAQIRLLDPAVVSPTFGQREANRRYWGFDEILSVDRYKIDGTLQDTVIGVRELSPSKLKLSEQSWVNQHITYTHGFGVAAAYGNQRNSDGEPAFIESGVPGQGALGTFEERVYFGKNSPDYSIVGAPEGSKPEEFDYQSGTDDSSEGTQRSNTFSGSGGPSLANPFVRFLYAVKFRDPNIVISNYVNDKSQILYDRDPQQRVKAVAPFLSLDSGMYPAVVDGRLVWVVDGYTSTDRYPYAQSVNLDDAVEDSQTDATDSAGNRVRDANYMRNGVKATVDAYDGSVNLYAWDTKDPILRAWKQAFPDAIKDTSEISGDLMSHLRYPEDIFKAQRSLLAKYHVTNPDEFFGEQDFWQVPVDPARTPAANPDGSAGTRKSLPPHYLSLQMPDQDSPRFSLSSSYIPVDGQDVLSGFLAVDSETGDQAGKPADSFGKLTLLNLPASNPVNGPGQVQATFNSDTNVSQALNLLKSGNSEVINGNLLTLPMGGGLLYVQPVYLQSSEAGGGAQYPLLQMVLVSFGDKIGFAPTLDEALDQVFGGDSGANAGDAGIDAAGVSGSKDTETGQSTSTDGGDAGQQTPADAPQRLSTALDEMEQAEKDAQAAMAAGDWTAYGEAQARLQAALQRAIEADNEVNGAQTSDGGGG